jgi:hypothetical protein
MEKEGCRRSWNQSLLEGYDEGSRVGLWDLAHLVLSLLHECWLNHCLYPPALSSLDS